MATDRIDPREKVISLAHARKSARERLGPPQAIMRLPAAQKCAYDVREMITYLKQIQEMATTLGVSLERACADVGIAPSTLRRWRNGSNACREDTARRVTKRLMELAAEIRSTASDAS
jgi:hypothetical protein